MSWKNAVVTGLVGAVSLGFAAFGLHKVRSNLLRSVSNAPPSAADSLLSRVVSSGPMARPRDAFRVIDQPQWISVDEAVDSMGDDEVVLGLEQPGEYRAYPINYLNDHEMVQERIGELPLLVTW